MIRDNMMIYSNAYSLIQKDYLNILEYIEPVDSNLGIYSHRIYELFLRISTEFENICKEKLIDDGYHKKPSEMRITDFRTLKSKLALDKCEIGLKYWNPKLKYVKPFADWASEDKPLGWYQSYNRVKHNRIRYFGEANLENLTLSLGSVFLVFFKLFRDRFFNPYAVSMSSAGSGLSEYNIHHVNNSIFEIKEYKL